MIIIAPETCIVFRSHVVGGLYVGIETISQLHGTDNPLVGPIRQSCTRFHVLHMDEKKLFSRRLQTVQLAHSHRSGGQLNV
jgi:hypothetical protein